MSPSTWITGAVVGMAIVTAATAPAHATTASDQCGYVVSASDAYFRNCSIIPITIVFEAYDHREATCVRPGETTHLGQATEVHDVQIAHFGCV